MYHYMAKTKTSVYKTDKEQYKVTIPKPLADAMSMDEDTKIVWEIASGNRLEAKVVDD